MKQAYPTIDRMLTATLFIFVAFSMFSISIAQIAGGIGGCLWLLKTHLANEWKEQRWPLGIPILLFSLASFVAVVNSYDINYSYPPLKKLLEFLIFFWVINCVRKNNLRNSLSLTLIISGTLAALFGLYQYWQAPPLHYGSVSSANRLEGTLSTYMTFAGLLMLVGVIALARIIFHKPIEKWLLCSIGIIGPCLLLTLTRQAWLGFFAALIFLFFFWRKKILLLTPVILMLIYIASPLPAQQRVKDAFSGKDVTFGMRTALWKGGLKVFKDYPLTGCGFRCVDLVHSQYPDPTGYIERYRGMHNNYIQLAVDTGVFGLTSWLGIWFYFFRFLYQKAVDLEEQDSERWIIFGSAAAALAFLTGGLFESNLYDSEVVMLLYFIMALPFSGSYNQRSA
jgi:putative inorganic carbon (hco3(-)) transporter